VSEGEDANPTDPAFSKPALRKALRAARRAHVEALNPRIRALVLMRPPATLSALIPADATIGLYVAAHGEAPALGYARHFHEAGHRIALPWFSSRDSAMVFRQWDSPHLDELLEPGPYGVPQPATLAPALIPPALIPPALIPDVLFVPLVGFTADGGRLGQGGGHYDRWLAAHPGTTAIGLAWDCQLVETLPREPHDRPLAAVITPTRLYGPFESTTS
jgi:5-formyltetrahydrofolate cyclo-ligase